MGRKWVERRRRGIIGWLFLLLFWGWNILVVALVEAFGKPEFNRHASAAECDVPRNSRRS